MQSENALTAGQGGAAMVHHKKQIYVLLFIILLLFFAAYIHTVEDDTLSQGDVKDDLTLMAEFSREDGITLGNNTVRLSSGESGTDYPLDGNGKLQITGLPRNGDLLLTVLDPQGQAVGRITLSISEGAVIDATTSEDGTGHITLRRDTDIISISFSLLDDGSLQCSLWLTQFDGHGRNLSQEGACYGKFVA